MAKLTLVLVVVLAFLDLGLSGFAGSRWNQGRRLGAKSGSRGGQCSAIRGLPDPKSGCCGRHAASGGVGGGDDNDIGDGNQEDDNGNDDDINGNDDGDVTGDDYPNGGAEDGGFPNGIGNGFPNNIGNGFPNGNGNDFDKIWEGGNGIGDIDFGNWRFNHKYHNKRSDDKNASDITPDKFITAGRPTGIAQYPWLVHLTVKIQEMYETKMIGCGGSLISSRHVITAAHCLNFQIRNYEDVSVFLAEYNTRSFPKDCVGRQCVKNIVMHPDKLKIHEQYERGVLYNDIGMIRLKGSAPYTDYVRPICLPPFNINNQKGGTTLTVTGWGQTGNGEASSVKLHTQVQLISPAKCQQHYPELTKGQVCAAGRRGQDTCMGDSGGPLMLENNGNFYLVGLVSGKMSEAGCGSPVPTLYTNVYAYKKWIDNFMRYY